MKQHITGDDLKTLSENQRQTLNSLWLPAQYDLVVASICKDAENDIFEDFEFVVGEVILSHGTSITLRSLKFSEDNISDNEELSEEDKEIELTEYETTLETGEFFSKEECLPLFNIGQLISFLRHQKPGQNGFSIGIPPLNDRFYDQYFTLNDRFGEVSKSEELVDMLFGMIKESL